MPRVVDGVKKFNVFAVAVSVAGSSPSDERIVLLRAKARMTHAEAMNLAVWILTLMDADLSQVADLVREAQSL